SPKLYVKSILFFFLNFLYLYILLKTFNILLKKLLSILGGTSNEYSWQPISYVMSLSSNTTIFKSKSLFNKNDNLDTTLSAPPNFNCGIINTNFFFIHITFLY